MYQVYFYTQDGKGTDEFETQTEAIAHMKELLWDNPVAPYLFQVIGPDGNLIQEVSEEDAS